MVKVKEEVRGESEEGTKTGHHVHYHWSYPNQTGQQPPPTPAPIHFGLGFEPQTSPHQHVVYFHVNPGVSFSFQMADTIQVIKGPVTVPMVSTSSSPPIAMPVQVPHGHVVQQIVDESGTLRHVILSPQHHPPMVPIPQHFGGGSGSATNGAQGFYPGPMPPHGFGPFSPMQPGVIPQHPQGHSPPPMNFHKDERAQRQYNKLKRKLEQKQMRDNPLTTSPPLSPRKELNGNARKGVSSVGTSEDGEESSSLQDEEEDSNAMLIHLLSSIKAPQVSEVTSRTALVQWSPPAVEQPQDLRYEVLLSDRGKEGKYKSIYTGEALSCRIEDLRPGTEYSVCVSARLDEPNVGRPSEPEVLITPACKPDAPPPPKLASRSRNALTLKWGAAADNGSHIDHYVVEWEVNGQWTEVARSKSKQAHIAKLQPATPFKFRVAAVNQFGKSEFSPGVIYETCDSPPPQPSPPSLFHSSPNSLTLHWVARPQDDDFTLQMEEPDSKHGFLAVYNGKETSHTCTSLKKNTCYKFRLKSQNEEGPSRWSDEVRYSTIPGRPSAPSRPQLKGKMHPYSFRIRWDPPVDKGGASINTFNVQIMPYNNQAEYQTVYTGQTPTCSVEKLIPGTVYQVRVNCEGPGGVSDYSEIGLFATEPVCPGQCEPPKVAGKPRPHSIPLKWSYPENDGGSEVTELELAMRDCSIDSKEMRTAYRGRDTETTVTDLTPATTYKFTIRAANKVGNGTWSDELEVVSGCGVPSRPEAPSLSTTPSGSVHAAWVSPQTNGCPITQYTLQMTTPPCEVYTQVYSGTNTQADVKPVPPATLCFFRIQASNSIGWSEWSELSSVVTAPGVPGAVPGLKATTHPTSLEISWGVPPANGDPITHYTVEAGDTTTSVTEPPCLVENLTPQTSYRIRVKAVNSVGSGAASTLKVSTLALPPRPPALACTTASHNYLKLKWGNNPNNHHYTVYMTSPNNRRSVVYEGTNTSCKISRLHEQTDYIFTIVAANATGKGPESETATFSTVIAPPPPIKGLKVTEVGHKSCQVEWSPLRPMASDNLEYIVQCARLRQQTFKQVYRGVDIRCQVKDLEPGADYLVRVGAVRLCGDDGSSVDGAFSLPASLSTPPIHHDNSTPTHAPRHNNQQVASRTALTDNQWAGIILCCFTVLAVFFAIMVANIIY